MGDGREEAPVRIEAAAAMLGVTVRWMRRAVEERVIPYHRVGRFLLFQPADLREFFSRTRVSPRDDLPVPAWITQSLGAPSQLPVGAGGSRPRTGERPLRRISPADDRSA